MPIESILPWEKVGADLFSWSGKDYLLTIDYFSGWRKVDRLNDTTATAVIHVLNFGRLGNPVHADQREWTTVLCSTIPYVSV